MALENALERNTEALEAFGQLLQVAIATLSAAATAASAPVEAEKPKRTAAKKSNTAEAADADKVPPATVEATPTPAPTAEAKPKPITMDALIPAFRELMNKDMTAAGELLATFGLKKLTLADPAQLPAIAEALGVQGGA